MRQMITYIRYRITTDKISLFKKSIDRIVAKKHTNGLISGLSFSQCMSEEENFIFRITWNTTLIKKTEISNNTIEKALLDLLDYVFRDYILEMRNYKIV